MKSAIAVALFSTAAAAQSALVINCSDCNGFQGIEVAVDGQSVNTGNIQPSVRVDVSAGRHEIQVWKWTSPFSREDVATQVLTFPDLTELRVKARPGRLDVYGKGKLEPVVTGPSQDAINSAADLISEARDYLREAAEYNDEEDSRCQMKVAERLAVVADHLKELRRNVDAEEVRRASGKANAALALVDRECPSRVQKALDKKLGKVIARLDKASSALR